MKHFILSDTPDSGGRIRLSGKDYHYLVRVRRLAPGEVFTALLPGGKQARIRVLAVDKICLIGECFPSEKGSVPLMDNFVPEEAVPGLSPAPALPPVYLFQALPKAAKMDTIVRQAAEGGVTGIVPFMSAHSVSRIASQEQEGRLERWRRIIREARQQSGSPISTNVEKICTIEELLAYWERLKGPYSQAQGFLFHQTPLEQGTFHGYLNNGPDLVAALIGPEGGFSLEETACFQAAGFKPLLMGDTVLRVETAAAYAVAAIRVILLERMSWTLKTPPLRNESVS